MQLERLSSDDVFLLQSMNCCDGLTIPHDAVASSLMHVDHGGVLVLALDLSIVVGRSVISLIQGACDGSPLVRSSST